MNTREKWIDSVRFIAILVVFCTHFIAAFHAEASKFWHSGVTGVILCGITGKFAVAMFAVILGYFAAFTAEKKGFCLESYICKRYIRFLAAISFTIIITELLVGTFSLADISNGVHLIKDNFFVSKSVSSILVILRECFLFGDSIFPLFWCMNSFFYASVIIAIVFSVLKYDCWETKVSFSEKLKIPAVLITVIIITSFSGYIWIGIGCMGGLVYWFNKNVDCSGKAVLAGCAAIFIIYKFIAWNYPENNMVYAIQGIVCSLIFCALWKCRKAKEFLNNKSLSKGGEFSFYIYTSHILIMYTWGYYIMDYLLGICSFKLAFVLTFISTVMIVLIVSWLLFILIEKKIVKILFCKLLPKTHKYQGEVK